jgi:hypothetical protein
MTRGKQLIAATIFAALGCAGLQAQSADLRASIPFNFRAGDRLMPAGEYQIQEQGPVVIVRPADGGAPASILLTVAVVTVPSTPRDPRLDFNLYGGEYFLTNIWGSYSENGRQVPQTARQKELAKAGSTPAKAMVALASNK